MSRRHWDPDRARWLPSISVRAEAYAQICIIAERLNISMGEVVTRMIDAAERQKAERCSSSESP